MDVIFQASYFRHRAFRFQVMRSRWTFPAVSAGKVSPLVERSVCPTVRPFSIQTYPTAPCPNNVQTTSKQKALSKRKPRACPTLHDWKLSECPFASVLHLLLLVGRQASGTSFPPPSRLFSRGARCLSLPSFHREGNLAEKMSFPRIIIKTGKGEAKRP